MIDPRKCVTCHAVTTWTWSDECWRCAKITHAREDADPSIALNTPDDVRAVLEGDRDPELFTS
jgi:hypothetical protein